MESQKTNIPLTDQTSKGGTTENIGAVKIGDYEEWWDESPPRIKKEVGGSPPSHHGNFFPTNGNNIPTVKSIETAPEIGIEKTSGGTSVAVSECSVSDKCNNPNSINGGNGNTLPSIEKFSENATQVESNTSEECLKDSMKSVNKSVMSDQIFVDHSGNISASVSEASSKEVLVSDESCTDPTNYSYRASSDGCVSDISNTSEDESVTETVDGDELAHKVPRRQEAVCRGEVLLSDLPPIEDLQIDVPEGECVKVGTIASVVDQLVIVQALPNTPALDLGSVLFLQNGRVALGKIFDVFGQVKEPFYTIRFNSANHVRERGVKVGADVYCAPKTGHTSYVFVSEMMKIKGSDASWEHNNEPPVICLDYSDDEEERRARKVLSNKKHREDKDKGPPRKRRLRQKQSNPSHLAGKAKPDPGVNYANVMRPEASPIAGHVVPPLACRLVCPPIFPSRPMYPLAGAHPTRPIHPPGHPPVMFSSPPPNFSLPLRSAFRPPLLGPHPGNFQPSIPPPLTPTRPPFYVRSSYPMLSNVPLLPPSPLPSPPFIVPQIRSLLRPSRFTPSAPSHEKKGPGSGT